MRLAFLFLFLAHLTLTACNKSIAACSEQSPPMSRLERKQLVGPIKQIETALYVAQPHTSNYPTSVKDQFWNHPGKWSAENADTSETYAQQNLSLYDKRGNLVRHDVQSTRSDWRKVSTYRSDSPCKQTIREQWVLRADAPKFHMPKPEGKTASSTIEHLDRQQMRLYRESNEFVTTTLFDLDPHGRIHRSTTTAQQDDEELVDKIEYIIIDDDNYHRPLKERIVYGDGATRIILYRYFNIDRNGNPRRRYKETWGHLGSRKGQPTQLISRELAVYRYTYFSNSETTKNP